MFRWTDTLVRNKSHFIDAAISLMMKFLMFVTVSLLVSTASAFDCYQCEYYEDLNTTNPDCNKEPVPEELLKPCDIPNVKEEEYRCVKKTGKTIEDEDKGIEEKKYVSRYCSASPADKNKNSCKESSGLDSPHGTLEKAFLCYCSDPGCNGASALSTTFFLLPLIALVGYNLH